VHVNRVSNRLGWVKTIKPEETEKELKKILPQHQWIRVNRLFVKFGQEICLPIKPKCEICPVNKICPKDFSIEDMIKSKRSNKKKIT
jgi:endonuclease-3